jgi:hypothetical protein
LPMPGLTRCERYCREACARAGGLATDAFASALKGIFPAKHSPMNLLYCDITLSLPPLSGPEPLSTARLKQASQVGVWLSRANAGIVTPGVASAARIAATAMALGLVLMVMSLPVYETKSRFDSDPFCLWGTIRSHCTRASHKPLRASKIALEISCLQRLNVGSRQLMSPYRNVGD